MGQLGFFDLNRRYESLTEKNDPLVAIAAMVPFESFRPKLHTALIKGELRRSEAERRNSAGRKPWDEVVIFKALVLQALYNLSDDQAEYQLRDRFSFMRFLGLELDHRRDDRVGTQAIIRARTTRRSRKAKRRKTGNPSRPRTARRTRTRAGRRSMNARISVTRTISASTAGTNSCAVTW